MVVSLCSGSERGGTLGQQTLRFNCDKVLTLARAWTIDSLTARLAHYALEIALRDRSHRAGGSVPAWQPPTALAALLDGPDGVVPWHAGEAEPTVEFLLEHVLPRPTGNTDPRFLGWVHGGGDELGIVASIITAAMNANTCGSKSNFTR